MLQGRESVSKIPENVWILLGIQFDLEGIKPCQTDSRTKTSPCKGQIWGELFHYSDKPDTHYI